MPTYTSYDQVGIKEDISAIITNLSPTRTPGQTMIGSGKTKNRVHQWQEDSLASATQANALVEGADASFATLVPTVMRDNVTQILGKSIQLSDTADTVDTHGRDKETAYQLRKVSSELKRDLEKVLFGPAQAKVAGSSSVARKMANALTLIDASTKVAAAAAPFSEALFMSAAEAAYTAGAEPSVLMIKPTDSTKVASFASATGRLRDIGNGTELTMVVDVLRTPYGTFKVTLNRFQDVNTAFLLDVDMWKLISLRPWFRETLAKTGDSVKMSVLGEYTLEHKALNASGAITGLA